MGGTILAPQPSPPPEPLERLYNHPGPASDPNPNQTLAARLGVPLRVAGEIRDIIEYRKQRGPLAEERIAEQRGQTTAMLREEFGADYEVLAAKVRERLPADVREEIDRHGLGNHPYIARELFRAAKDAS